ncbi:cysteine-rich RLK (RECEPTOR-like protein kinase) 34 [Actinidia rufa]|uniref:non-specific serine/threonine protein kinase n=1 Tax=Actinidia rufa TaxID=165716 RepID=A0A7J0D863_9ERIC|nr:cysteine-rich RLK (RECEPTOR-like protein kinase) 34 [Actinidia rufa]
MLSQNKFINDSTTLESARKKFQLGFFRPGNSKHRYLGIWYSNIPIQTVVWVANRNNPLNDSSGVLKIGDDGNLILLDETKRVVWNTSIQKVSSETTVVKLLDSGNLVLSSGNTESYLWQSFDHPSDTLLAGMKLGWDFRIGLNRYLTSWRNPDDPSTGEFSYGIELFGLPQNVLRKNSVKVFRSSHWLGVQYSSAGVYSNHVFNSNFVLNSQEVYYEYGLYDQLTRSVLNYSGTLQRLVWKSSSQEWLVMYSFPTDPCDSYGQCGPNAVCTINNLQICSCLAGYAPKSSPDWEMHIWSGGCVRKNPFNCSEGEGFIELKGVEIPDLLRFWMNTSMTPNECEVQCLKNCSCTAYTHSAITEGSRSCLLWYGDLIDMKRHMIYGDQNLYIRVTASELENRSDSQKKVQLMAVIIPVSVALLFLLLASCITWKKRTQKQGSKPGFSFKVDENIELPIFSVVTIAEATNNFSFSNKIGEGGFGSVYKAISVALSNITIGQLSTGQEIAVKRLSEDSHQGLHEFKNEVILISKLQHRNLVRLLGCCVQGGERMLIYEYMSNGSLSSFIFDNRSNSLTWSRRFNIIVGIARGLLYLHRDSRLRIIHRDLKASNVLLDGEMNPKISDFGIARAFGGDQLLDKTRTVMGTYGYMSPEYIIHGLFSMKSDVFSFGVLVLEIVSGKRNGELCDPDQSLRLLGYTWRLWNEGKAIELLDVPMEDSFEFLEVLKCIQIGLLCVQKRPEDRPTMASVLSALDSEITTLPQPKQPGFYAERSTDVTLDGTLEARLGHPPTHPVGRRVGRSHLCRLGRPEFSREIAEFVTESELGRRRKSGFGGGPRGSSVNHRRAVAATILTSLAVVEVNKATIGSYPHAIRALVSLFRVRNTREQKEAAMAIFALCSFLDNRRRIVNCGSVPILIRIANSGLERADEVLGLLAKCKEGREEMVKIFHDCVQVLVHVLRNRSSRGVQYALMIMRRLGGMLQVSFKFFGKTIMG